MITLKILHRTNYHYGQPVSLQPHRLMLRPREGRDLRLLSFHVTMIPDATLAWTQDVAGNAIATASFHEMTDHLRIDSVAELELYATRWPIFDISASAIFYPFRYSEEDWMDLGVLAVPQYPDATMALREWARAFVRGNPTDTLSLLKDINAWIPTSISYEVRYDEGTQTPAQTLDRRRGSCRDLAVLFVEAARSLGFGARLVSGYLYSPDQTGPISGVARRSGWEWATIRMESTTSLEDKIVAVD